MSRARRPLEAHAQVDLDITDAASLSGPDVLSQLATTSRGLSSAEAQRRRLAYGPNAVHHRRIRGWVVLGRQLKSPLLWLLLVTASVSFFLGERADAVIIGVIVGLSVGLGFWNELRAEQAAHAMRSRVRYDCLTWHDEKPSRMDVDELVPGDVVELQVGEIVPADLRILRADGLACDEAVLTGESEPATKTPLAVPAGTVIADSASCAFMGTVVHTGSATGVVVATGSRTQLGRVAQALGEAQPETEFQVGLRQFSLLLVQVAAVLTTTIFVANVFLHRSVLDSLLFSLAIAVGITPQLLPAIVSTSLAAGSRQLARRKVLVKRLVCIEDLGDIDVLLTDKTGTLTDGQVTFMRAMDADASPSEDPVRLALLCNEAVDQDGREGGNPLDAALWASPEAELLRPSVDAYRRLAILPFDHDRQMSSVVVTDPRGRALQITKGAPEVILQRCEQISAAAQLALSTEFAAGSRVIAIATREAKPDGGLTFDDENDLRLAGFAVFLDPPKAGVTEALARLAGLGVEVKIVTGDNATVAKTVSQKLGLPMSGTVTGAELNQISDEALPDLVARTTVFARVSPEQKARIVRAHRGHGIDVAFLGDGVNDALALHAADVGISVDSGTDVARDAADIILLEKELSVLADGVAEGRRIFANTMKYVLMGTSSNFGNMVSAAVASLFLPFLPMLPGQILLNNLLYDSSQLTIPTDNVDDQDVARPRRWDIALVRRFMLTFGPISSIFDFLTFGVMLQVFNADAELFRSGWFVESMATQCLVVFCIRTRRVPFFRSRPSRALLLSVLGVVLIAVAIPQSPLAPALGFQPLPLTFFAALVAMVIAYLVLIDATKAAFYRHAAGQEPAVRQRRTGRRVWRRSSRFTHVHGQHASQTPSALVAEPTMPAPR